MKTPRFYALRISLLVALVLVVILVLHGFLPLQHSLVYFMVLGLLTAVLVFFIIRMYFIRFVEKEIDPIFKTLQSFTMSRKARRSKIEKGKLISELDREVKIWTEE